MTEMAVITTPTDNEMIPTENSTNTTFRNDEEIDWKRTLRVFEVINFIILAFTILVLLIMIIYGTKTKRWTKGVRGSSLNDGLVFITSVVAIALTLPKLAILEVMFNIPQFQNGEELCELVGDLRKAAYVIGLFGTYFFLCLRQRLIYTHPYVKEKVTNCMNFLSRAIFFVLTIVAIALVCYLVSPRSHGRSTAQFCLEDDEDYSSIVLASVFITTQAIMLVLCIYPAFRVRLCPKSELQATGQVQDHCETNNNYDPGNSLAYCWRFISEVATSPVEMTIKRTLLATTLIVFSDIAAYIIEASVVPVDAPLAVHQTVIDIGSFVDILCIVGTFGFAGKIFTLLLPKCRRLQRKTQSLPVEESTGSTAFVTEQP